MSKAMSKVTKVMSKKLPSVFSAADVARVVSRRLRRAGLTMADRSDRCWTTGIFAWRLGCSTLVKVDFHSPRAGSSAGAADWRAARTIALDRAREILTAAGYVLDDQMQIKCERS